MRNIQLTDYLMGFVLGLLNTIQPHEKKPSVHFNTGLHFHIQVESGDGSQRVVIQQLRFWTHIQMNREERFEEIFEYLYS